MLLELNNRTDSEIEKGQKFNIQLFVNGALMDYKAVEHLNNVYIIEKSLDVTYLVSFDEFLQIFSSDEKTVLKLEMYAHNKLKKVYTSYWKNQGLKFKGEKENKEALEMLGL